MTKKISLVSNVSRNDLYRIRHIIPHWFRMFPPETVDEILLVLDRMPTSGRIASLHQFSFREDQIETALREVAAMDSRVRCIDLDKARIDRVSQKYFGMKGLIRCQGGTPIFPFFFAIEEARNSLIIKLDSDMVFSGKGIAAATVDAFAADPALVLMNLPRFGLAPQVFSTRAFALDRHRLEALLPIRHLRLDPIRYFHRLLTGRAPCKAPEQALERETKSGRIKHAWLDSGKDSSLHVTLSWWPGLKDFPSWINALEVGNIPRGQQNWDFQVSAWESDTTSHNKSANHD